MARAKSVLNSLMVYTLNLQTLLNLVFFTVKWVYATMPVEFWSDFGVHFPGGQCSVVVIDLHFHSPQGCLFLPHLSTCPSTKTFLSLAYPISFLLFYQVSYSLPHSSHSITGTLFQHDFQHLPVCLTV